MIFSELPIFSNAKVIDSINIDEKITNKIILKTILVEDSSSISISNQQQGLF